MGIFDGIEKVINEHGSSVILGQQLAFAKEQYTALEGKVNDLQVKAAKFEAHLEIERENHQKTAAELSRLKEEHAEEIRIDNSIEFRRGKRTGGKWVPFCPACHIPLDLTTGIIRCAIEKCGWYVLITTDKLDGITSKF